MPTYETLTGDPILFFLLAVAAFIVGLSKGGLPAVGMLSVPLLSLNMSPMIAAVLLLPIYLLSDVFSVWLYRKEYSAPNLKILIPAGTVGVAIGWAMAAYVSDQMVALLVGVMGILFCLHTWTKKDKGSIGKPASIPRGIFWGTFSGFTSFISHAGGPPFQIFVLPQKLPKMVFAGTSTITFAVINLAKVVPYSMLHPYNKSTLLVCALLVPAAAIGTLLGKSLIKRLSEKWFYLTVQIALFIICVRLVVGAIGA
ncbi:MAG: sulfite exporter TauE/SafE family protein [Gammaproteobacteria bacterium]|nr:sulfite exporter TauE/SafE family protein [Gammaproteobacteria bacterium]